MNYGQYRIRQILPDTYAIADFGFFQSPVQLFLLVGSEKALLIDSGYGGLPLTDITRQLTNREVVCACTHGHVDHALGAFQFEKAYLHSADSAVYHKHRSDDFLRACAYQGIGLPAPKRVAHSAGFIKNAEHIIRRERTALLALEEVEAFELGGRRVSWRLLPGHTGGSTVFYDEKNGAVFEGDAAPGGLWLFLPESLSLAQYRDNLEGYLAWLRANKIKRRYTGHGNPEKPESLRGVEALLAACGCVLSGRRRGLGLTVRCGEPLPARLVFHGGTALFCSPGDVTR